LRDKYELTNKDPRTSIGDGDLMVVGVIFIRQVTMLWVVTGKWDNRTLIALVVLLWKELIVWKLLLLWWLSVATDEEASSAAGIYGSCLVFEAIMMADRSLKLLVLVG